jgi:hypothetical protein
MRLFKTEVIWLAENKFDTVTMFSLLYSPDYICDKYHKFYTAGRYQCALSL